MFDTQKLKFGYIAGGLSILVLLLTYLFIDQFSTVGKVVNNGIVAVNLGLCIYAVIDAKKKNGGYLTFKEAFSAFMLNRIVNIVLAMGFMTLLYFVIDPDFRESIAEKTTAMQIENMEKRGASEEVILQQAARLEQYNLNNPIVLFWTFMGSIVFNALVGLLLAAGLKRDVPEELR